MYTQSINLSVIPEGVRPVIHCSQYDTNVQAFRFKLYVRGAEYIIPDGVAVLMNGKKPDGNGFSYAAASITGNVATFNTTQQMTAVAGDVLCELRVRASNQIIGTINFILRVEPAPLDDDTIISDTDIPLIEQAVEIAANLAQYIQETRDNAAAAQDSADAAAASATDAATDAASAASDAASVQNLYDSIETAKANANAAAQAANSIANELDNMTVSVSTLAPGASATGSYNNGVLSLGIPQGQRGDSGAYVQTNGFVGFYVGSDGYLYIYFDDTGTVKATNFSYDSETGVLYYVYDDGEV